MDTNTIIDDFITICDDFHSIATMSNINYDIVMNITKKFTSMLEIAKKSDSDSVREASLKITEDLTLILSDIMLANEYNKIQIFDYFLQQEKKYLILYKRGENEQKLSMNNSNIPETTYSGIKNLTLPTIKVQRALYDPANTSALYKDLSMVINVGKRGEREINTMITIDIAGLEDYGVADIYLNPFDREVHDVICTLYDHGNTTISPGMIFHILSGNKKNSHSCLTQEMRDIIIKSVQKMMGTIVTINAEAEVSQKRNGQTTTLKAKYIGAVLPATRYEGSINGHIISDAIQILDTPPLYKYAKDKKQITSIAVETLNTPLVNSPDNIKLTGYIVRYIKALKRENSKLSDCLLYDTLYKYLQISAPNNIALNKKKLQIRKKIKKLLDFWVQIKFINSYEEIKEKNSNNTLTFTKFRLVVEKDGPSADSTKLPIKN